jgi:branched-chain amino acid transport system permease protein
MMGRGNWKFFLGLSGGLLLLILLPLTFKISSYSLHIFIMVLYFSYLSSAWNLLGGFAGQHSIGHSAFVGLGAYTSTFLFLQIGLNPWIGMVLGAILASLAGLFIGFLSFHYRLRGLYFVLVTIAFAEILAILFANIRFLGGASGLVVPLKEESLWLFQFRSKVPYYYIILTMLALNIFFCYWVRWTRLGYYLMAIRENEDAARAMGIRVMDYKLLATALSAFLSALGGTFYAQYTYFIDPLTVFGFGLSIEILIYPIVGGVGTVLGPVIGTFVLYPFAELIRTLLGARTAGIHLMVYGAILVAIMILAPRGIVGLFEKRFSPKKEK